MPFPNSDFVAVDAGNFHSLGIRLEPVGACCDTNGPDSGCIEGVTEFECVGSDRTWNEGGTCSEITCECIPDCTGAECGDDGCGGSCGTCDDGNGCTDDSCDGSGQCVYTPNSAPCDDGNICTGNDTCASGACGGTLVVCNDNNACNGFETCDPSSGCILGTPLNCNDGDFCNGLESCSAATGCVPGEPPCAEDETCDEDADQCIRNTIPTVSQWGLVVLTMLLLVAAKVHFGQRKME